MVRIRLGVAAGQSVSDIYVGNGILSNFPAILSKIFMRGKVALVADSRMSRQATTLAARLMRSGWHVSLKKLHGGEAAKSHRALLGVYDHLIGAHADRGTPLIAIGGGTIGDAAGFAAATYFRGIPLVHVPTTLLAQVDSAIGGKTAVNHPKAKNAIGAFHQPRLVLADTQFLKTLPRREFEAGMAEVVKYALVFDPGFGRWLDRNWDDLLRQSPQLILEMVARSIRWKTRIVAGDERDLSGRRELLNFGHTVGHAIEAASGFKMLHGEAVAWGMHAAVEISLGRGWMKRGAGLALGLLERLPSRPWPSRLRPKDLLEPMLLDKKVRVGRGVFVLLRELGKPVRVDDVGREELLRALEAIR